MYDWLIDLAVNHPLIVYVVVALFACPIGPLLSIILGLLLHLGYFSLVPLYGVLMFGDLIGDTVLYYLGYRYGPASIDKFGKYIGITQERVNRASGLFHKYKNPILFFSKITNGFGLSMVTLLTAGIVRIPFSRYIAFNMLGQFIWTGALLYIGFAFGELYKKIDTWNSRLTIFGGIIVLCLVLVGYVNYRRNKKNE
jgi:membrane protein DedA with SNARE-associated domain